MTAGRHPVLIPKKLRYLSKEEIMMKRVFAVFLAIILLVPALSVATDEIEIGSTNFPNASLRTFLRQIDSDQDGYLSLEEREAISLIFLNQPTGTTPAGTLQGIEFLPNLTNLLCEKNNLTGIDATHNTHLIKINCQSNYLRTLLVSGCAELQELLCTNNKLTELDVSGLTNLKKLYCSRNELACIDVTGLDALEDFACNNNFLTVQLSGGRFDLRTLPGFDPDRASDWQGGTVEDGYLTAPVGAAVTYTYDCGNGFSADFMLLTEASDDAVVTVDEAHFPDDGFRDWVSRNLDLNHDGSLNESEVAAVTSIDVSDTPMENLDGMEVFTGLENLNCGNCGLTSLNLRGFSMLKELGCSDNPLSSLDLSGNPELEVLYCGNCGLKSLDLSALKKLGFLECHGNMLTGIDTSANPELYALICTDNAVESLDVSGNPLVKLMCENNRLTQIDVRGKGLYFLYCSGNQLTSVNMTGQPYDVDFVCENNILAVKAENGVFDLSSLPGFDPSHASGWTGASVQDGVLTVKQSGNVTYTYDCGSGYSAVFTLAVTVSEAPATEAPATEAPATEAPATEAPSIPTPGDVNGDGNVDMQDALRLLQALSGMPLPIHEENADADKNGTINILDAMLILQAVCGWDVML